MKSKRRRKKTQFVDATQICNCERTKQSFESNWELSFSSFSFFAVQDCELTRQNYSDDQTTEWQIRDEAEEEEKRKKWAIVIRFSISHFSGANSGSFFPFHESENGTSWPHEQQRFPSHRVAANENNNKITDNNSIRGNDFFSIWEFFVFVFT